MKIHQGKLQAKGLRIAIVVSRFNSFISERLLEGAVEALQKMGALDADITVYKVPGAFEVPLVAKKIARSKMVLLQAEIPMETVAYAIERAAADVIDHLFPGVRVERGGHGLLERAGRRGSIVRPRHRRERAAADVKRASFVAEPRSPAAGPRRSPRAVAAESCRARARSHYHCPSGLAHVAPSLAQLRTTPYFHGYVSLACREQEGEP